MKSLLLSGVCLVLLAAATPHAAQQAQEPTAPPDTSSAPQPTTGPETPQEAAPAPERDGRQGRSPRRSRREPPPAPTRDIDDGRLPRSGGPTQQTLAITANLLAGYDDNLTAGLGTGGGALPSAMASGYTGSLDGTLDYLRGNRRHELRVASTGSVLGYPGYLDRPAAGAAGTVDGRTSVGRSVTLGAGGRLGYEPFFNALSPGALGTPPPPGTTPAAPVAGLFERRSLNTNARASLEVRASRRDSMLLSYSFGSQQFQDDTTEAIIGQTFFGGDSTRHSAEAGYRRVVASGVRLRSDYQYSDIEFVDASDVSLPTRTHRVDGGVDVEHGVGRDRLVTWSFAAGAARLEALGVTDRQPYATWVPVGSGSVRVPIAGSWSAEGSYRREFNLLQGVTDDVYATDTALISTTGSIAPRSDLRLSGTWSNWKTPLASGVTDTFKVYGIGVQVRVFLSDTVGLAAAYYFYNHRYSNPEALPAGFPAAYDRNAVRIGLTLRLPLKSPATRRLAAGT